MIELGLGRQSDSSAPEYARLGRLAEEHGFGVVTVSHDLLSQPAFDPAPGHLVQHRARRCAPRA